MSIKHYCTLTESHRYRPQTPQLVYSVRCCFMVVKCCLLPQWQETMVLSSFLCDLLMAFSEETTWQVTGSFLLRDACELFSTLTCCDVWSIQSGMNICRTNACILAFCVYKLSDSCFSPLPQMLCVFIPLNACDLQLMQPWTRLCTSTDRQQCSC